MGAMVTVERSPASGPCTRGVYSAACSEAARDTRRESALSVQARRNGLVYCGQVVAWQTTPAGLDLAKVQTPADGVLWVTPSNLRLCSGAGCTCEAPAGPALAERAGQAGAGVGGGTC